MQARRDSSEMRQDESAKKLGLLYTGHLDKKNPVNGSYRGRFVVLTHDFVHWFKRSKDSVELFGEERGHVGLESIVSVRVIDEDSTCFELQSADNVKRYFRGNSLLECEEWVSAIRSAVKGFSDKDNGQTDNHEAEVVVNLVTLKTKAENTELVISRNPTWDRIINVPSLRSGDMLYLSTTNGGMVSLTYEMISSKSEDGIDFEVSVQSVPLASCLRMTVRRSLIHSETKESRNSKNSFAGFIGDMTAILLSFSMDRNNSLTLVLSVIVLIMGTSSLSHLSRDTSFLFLAAVMLSFNCIYRLVVDMMKVNSVGGSDRVRGALFVALTIHGHTFTSPDAPISHDDDIPKRFIDGCEGDIKEARRRWEITRSWRESEGVDKVLETKQPYFNHIKSLYPFYHAGRGREGHIVFYERPGDLESAQLAARGIVTEDLLRHWIFIVEYQWVILAGGDELAKGIAVIDVGTVRFGDLAGDNLEYVRKTIGYANAHYPERSHVIYLVNAPGWFSILWRIVKPMVHPNTQAKVRILTRGDTLKGLQEHIDISNIPEYYGGQLDFGGKDSCRFNSPEVVELNNFVQRINEGVPQPKNQFDEKVTNTSPAPPGRPGEHYSKIMASSSGISHSHSTDSYASSSCRARAELDKDKDKDRDIDTESEMPPEVDYRAGTKNYLKSRSEERLRVSTNHGRGRGGASNRDGESMFSQTSILPLAASATTSWASTSGDFDL